MKKVIKKNQVIITSLAILIAVAGYLNFADVDLGVKDKEASTDSSSILEDAGYDLTDSENTSTPGEAVLTGTDSFAAQARISREQTRSQNKADLQDIINNKDIDDEKKQEVEVWNRFGNCCDRQSDRRNCRCGSAGRRTFSGTESTD